MDKKAEYSYWLGTIPGIGVKKIQKLLEYAENAENIYHLKEEEIRKISFLTEKDKIEMLSSKKKDRIRKRLEKLKERKISYVTREMEEYPKRLIKYEGSPYLLYYKGELPQESMHTAAIIGSRKNTPYGNAAAKEFAWYFARNQIQIVSGMASGIDGISQKSALEAGGKSYAVLGSGVEVCYPKENRMLYEQLKQQGGVLSEYDPFAQPRAGFFPARNRIISGLADVLLVVEAREKSGSLITVEFALEQGKEIFAVPGRINDLTSRGCNELISDGAGVANSPEGVLEALGWAQKPDKKRERTKVRLEKKERLVYSCLSLVPVSLDQMTGSLSLPPSEILQILVGLQMEGIIVEIAKNQYIINEKYEIL